MNNQLVKNVLCEIGVAVRDKIYQSLRQQSADKRSSIFAEGNDDTIYQIDRDVEDIIVPCLKKHAEKLGGIVLIAEGISDGELVLPDGYSKEKAAVKIIMDPIDGTRGIMYDKRNAFFLAAASPNIFGATLKDVEVAVMVELPTSRCYLADTITAVKNQGVVREIFNLITGETIQGKITPSRSDTIY